MKNLQTTLKDRLRIFFTGIFPKIVLILVIILSFFLMGILAVAAGLATEGQLASAALRGLFLGVIYGLIALGYTMVYGVLKFINFAHGDVFMVGAVISFVLVYNYSMDFLAAIIASMIVCGLIGALIEKIAYKPLRHSSRLTPLITAIGVSLLLQSLVQLTFGPDPKTFSMASDRIGASLNWLEESPFKWHVGSTLIQVKVLDLLILTVSVTVMVLLHVFITYTRTGKAIRATADDFETASTIGINIDRVITATFVVGSMLAALGGIFYGLKFVIEFNMGILPGIKAFTAAVVGGIGNIYGAMLGGIIIGLSEKVGGLLISTDLETAIVFAVLIIFLLVRPNGILGKKEGGLVARGRLGRLRRWLTGTMLSSKQGPRKKAVRTQSGMNQKKGVP